MNARFVAAEDGEVEICVCAGGRRNVGMVVVVNVGFVV